MKIYCHKNEFIKNAEEYVISYLLNHAGFFFDWITDPEEKKSGGLLLIYRPESIEYKLTSKIIYLSKHFDLKKLTQSNFKWEKVTIGKDIVPILIDPDRQSFDKSDPHLSSFDLVANVYYHLTRLEELNFQHPDDIDNNIQKSVLFKHGNFLIPVVDSLGNFFKREVERKFKERNSLLFKKALYPEGQTFGIALTHDVDFIRAFHPLKKRILKLSLQLGLKMNTSIQDIDQQDNDVWGFDRLLSFYKNNNYPATFFFMAKYMEGRHFRYRIGSRKIRQLFGQLKSDKHEIAFHPSRYAFENPKRYLREKRKLEKISVIKLSGLRHHYLRCLFPQIWRTTAKLNLDYEAGMIHRRHKGFRAGTCFPFPVFDHPNQKRIDIMEFPTTFFENTLPDKGGNFEASKEAIQQLLSIVRNQGGLLNILWHSNNIYFPDTYRKLWEFITRLIKDEDAYLQTLKGHFNWNKFREQIQLRSIKKSKLSYVIDIALPEVIHPFCLHVPANYTYNSESKLLHDPNKNTLIIENNLAQSRIIIEALAK